MDMELFVAIEHQGHVNGDRRLPLASSDDSLLRASAAGDGAAFAELYERHAGTIYNYLFRRSGDWSEAEDLTAVVFLEAFRRRGDVVVVEGKLLPWLYGVATNVLRNRQRALWRHRRVVTQLGAQRVGDVAADVVDRVEAAAQTRAVLKRVAGLPRRQQDVVSFCIWSGLTYEETAVALGVPVGTVRSRLSRARAALAELDGASGHRRVEMCLEEIGEK